MFGFDVCTIAAFLSVFYIRGEALLLLLFVPMNLE